LVALAALFVAFTALRIVGGKKSELLIDFSVAVESRKKKG